jgi:hypothetical protein
MRIEYMNWITEKILCHTLIEKYQKGNEYAYKIYELDTRKVLCLTLIEKYQKGNEYAYKIYELDT